MLIAIIYSYALVSSFTFYRVYRYGVPIAPSQSRLIVGNFVLFQSRISTLKEEKRQLAEQLKAKSAVSSMRSIGVGHYDVDEEMTKIERV